MSAASASGGDAPDVRAVWRACDAVCFDVDSTVCVGEGIDELAEFAGRGEEVRRWTTKAMDGNVSFRDALSARLTIIEPSKMLMDAFLESSPPRLSAGMLRLSEALHARGKEVFLVSGGFRQMIEPVARIIGIDDRANVYANTILFDPDSGAYAGFDEREYTSESGGKARAVQAIKGEHGFSSVVMVGDGATDAEARQPGGADLFVGYGGSVERAAVRERADWYVFHLDQLTDALEADEGPR